jgi:hypothetical protein
VIRDLVGKPKGDLDIGRRVILKWLLKKYDEAGCGLDSSGSH